MRGRGLLGGSGWAYLAAVLAVLVGAVAALAHDIYIGYGQVEVRERELCGQLAYNKPDLVQALVRLHGSEVESAQPEEFDRLLRRYLEAHFQTIAATGALPLEIVEREENGDNEIFRFRVASSEALTSVRVRNDVLFELFPQQVNTLTVRRPSGVSRYVFHPGRRIIEVPLVP